VNDADWFVKNQKPEPMGQADQVDQMDQT